MDLLTRLLFPNKRPNVGLIATPELDLLEKHNDEFLSEPFIENANDPTPNTELITNLELDLSEEDIDNFLSKPSVQNLMTSESIASVTSLFSHLDELDLIRKEIITEEQTIVQNGGLAGTSESVIDDDDERHDQESPIEEITTVENTLKNTCLEAIAKNVPQETSIKLIQNICEINQIPTDSSQELKAPPLVDSGIESIDAYKNTCKINTESNNENNRESNEETDIKIAKNFEDIEQTLANLTEKIETPHTLLISLASKQTHIAPNTPEISNTLDLSIEKLSESNVHAHYIIAPKEKECNGEFSKAKPPNMEGLNGEIVIDLLSEAEEDNNIEKIPLANKSKGGKRKENVADNLFMLEPNSISAMDVEHAMLRATLSPVYLTHIDKDSNKILSTTQCHEMNVQNSEIDDSNDKIYDSDCSGYHSSDFEFISEAEATMDGLIINTKNKSKSKTTRRVESNNVRTTEIAKEIPQNGESFDENQPGPSNYQREEEQPQNLRADVVIPQGNNYLQLFQWQYNLNIARYMENKSVFSSINPAMHIEYDDEQNVAQIEWDVGDEYRNEAMETAKRIREMYAAENRKRLRRY